METKKVAKEYLQKDILRTIFQMRKRQEDDKQIKRIIVLDYDLTEYREDSGTDRKRNGVCETTATGS
ncbi:MAG: hypothetical protein ACLRHJ_13010 [Faecalimonas umbilicata]|uniref:hypothetical protein n=1 Tax=Faecalimonas umbilicata TaxID=1912855 RepID=UPI00399F3E5A